MKIYISLTFLIFLTACTGWTYDSTEYLKLTALETEAHILYDSCDEKSTSNLAKNLKSNFYNTYKYMQYRTDETTMMSMDSLFLIHENIQDNYDNSILCKEWTEQFLVSITKIRESVASKPGDFL